MNVKPGWKTTEFWVSVAVFVLVQFGVSTEDAAGVAPVVVNAIVSVVPVVMYILGRVALKNQE